MVKVGDRVQFWLGLGTVKATVIGFGQDNQVILRQIYDGVNKYTGRIQTITEVYYRDKTFINSLNGCRNS